MFNFSLTPDQIQKLDTWVADCHKRAVAEQKATPPDVPIEILESCWEAGFPYTGATGGDLTYSFTPTSIGVMVKIRNGLTNDTLDVTDWENW